MNGHVSHPRFKPFDFKRWIDHHRDLLKPPVGNKLVFEEAGMVSDGGRRTESAGRLSRRPGRGVLSTSSKATWSSRSPRAGGSTTCPSAQGKCSCCRPTCGTRRRGSVPGSVGLVVESPRADGMRDGFEWYLLRMRRPGAPCRCAGREHRHGSAAAVRCVLLGRIGPHLPRMRRTSSRPGTTGGLGGRVSARNARLRMC